MSYFVLTLKLNTQPFQDNILNKRLEIGRQLYNSSLRELFKRYNRMIQSKEYQKTLKMTKGRERNKEFRRLDLKYGITEYSLHPFMKSMQHHFKKNIDTQCTQAISTRVFSAFKKFIFNKNTKVKYKKFGEMNSLEGKTNNTGIMFRENKIKWFGLNIPVNINDSYIQMALYSGNIKYCRIIRKLIRGKYKFYVQLVMKGIPPVKFNSDTGELKHPINEGKVGIDIGTQTVAISSEKTVKLLELAPESINIEKYKNVLQRKLERQRRINNPNKYNKDGTIKKDNKEKWKYSKNYFKTKIQLSEIQRKVASIRKLSHHKLANYILSIGNEIYVETMDYKELQAKVKQATINEKTGKYNSKKRFGKSILNKAPSMLLSILDTKLKVIGKELNKINTYSVKASQYNHITNEYNKKLLDERWNEFGDFKIQRDLYSAFLIMNVNDDLKTVNRDWCFEKFDRFKDLHDIEIKRIKNSNNKSISSMGI